MARWFFLLTVVTLLVLMVGCGKQPAKTADELGIAGLNQFQLADAILAEEIRIADLATTNYRAARKAAADLAEKVAFMDKSSAWCGGSRDIVGIARYEQEVLDRPWWQRVQRRNWTERWVTIRKWLKRDRGKLYPPGHDRSIAEFDAEFRKRIPDMDKVVTDYPLVYLRAAEAEKLFKSAEAINEVTNDDFVIWVAKGVSERARMNIELSWKVRLAPTFQIVVEDEVTEQKIQEWREKALRYWKVNYERRLAPDATATSK